MGNLVRTAVCLGLIAAGVSAPTPATATQHRPAVRVKQQSQRATRPFKDFVKFTPATVVDPILFGGEPGLNFDNALGHGKRSYVDWPVSSRTNIGVLFRSTDGGLSYVKRYADVNSAEEGGPGCTGRQVPFCPSGGGGDTQVHINPGNDILYFTSQESLANQAVGASFDHGSSFPAANVDPVAAQTSGDVDRQWLASWAGTRTVFLAYHSPLVGEYIMRSDDAGATGSWANASGVNVPQIPGVVQSGALIADNTGGRNNHTLYVAYIGLDTSDPNGADHFYVAASKDGGATFTPHVVPGADNARNFTKVTMDTRGNLYATWTDNNTQKSYLSTSLASDPKNRKAPGSLWSKKVVVSDASQNVTIFPDVVAGDPGRIAIGYYGTTAKAKTPDDVKPGAGGWYPIAATSFDALCQWKADACASPKFQQSHIAHQINQDDNICTSGTTCAATGGNRNLLDYFSPSLDKDGHLGFVWSDGTNSTKLPFVKVARQATGPSFYRGGPTAHLSMRRNGFPDRKGDARYPFAGAQVKTAKNHRQLDLRGVSVQPRYGAGKLVFHLRLTSTRHLAKAVPGGGSGNDGATPLQQAKYLVRWDFRGASYYAFANLAAGATKPTYGSGVVSTSEGLMAPGGTAPYGNTYAAAHPARGKVKNRQIIIKVPMKDVGKPQAGQRLVSVGSYALLGPTDDLATLNTAPITVDASPTFDYRMVRPAHHRQLALESAPAAPSSPWPLLPLAVLLAGAAIAVLRPAALPVRRRADTA